MGARWDPRCGRSNLQETDNFIGTHVDCGGEGGDRARFRGAAEQQVSNRARLSHHHRPVWRTGRGAVVPPPATPQFRPERH